MNTFTEITPKHPENNSESQIGNSSLKQNSMYTTRQIKEIESKILYDIVHEMPYVDRKYFITKIIEQCDVPRRHFYNWQDGYARIPTFAKKVIELIVGRPLFEATQGM